VLGPCALPFTSSFDMLHFALMLSQAAGIASAVVALPAIARRLPVSHIHAVRGNAHIAPVRVEGSNNHWEGLSWAGAAAAALTGTAVACRGRLCARFPCTQARPTAFGRSRVVSMAGDSSSEDRKPQAMSEKPHATLILSRHGESQWNVDNKFTGWVDVDLSEKGVGEAKAAGGLLKEAGYTFNVCYTSFLKRAIKTLDLVLEECDQMYAIVKKSWRLNERMYGGLTGQDKKQTVVKHGAEQVQVWRRSFDIPPPPLDEDSEFHPRTEAKYAGLSKEEIPNTECLKDTIARVMPYWEKDIIPDLNAGKTVFVAAHGNSIRAIVKHIEEIPEDVIPDVEIPTGTPLVYELTADLKPIPQELAVPPLKYGRYLGDPKEIKAAAEAVKNQTRV